MSEVVSVDKLGPQFTLRQIPAVPSDAEYAACVDVQNQNYPDHARTVEELKERDQNRDAKLFDVRFLMMQGDVPVGYAHGGHSQWQYHPRRFRMSVEVVPGTRRQGIGSVLYDAVRDALAPLDPIKLSCHAREDWPDSIKFSASRGFVEEMREFESRLDVANFDPALFADRREIPARHGIGIVTLAELQSLPDWAHRLYELERATSEDVPDPEPFTFPSEEEFIRMTLERSNFLPDGYAIARDTATGEWVGSSALWKRQADNCLDTGLTGVLRSHRRMGIAFALKLKVIDYAKSVGCPRIATDNATTNRPMLSINEALGYVKQPAWIMLGLHLGGSETP